MGVTVSAAGDGGRTRGRRRRRKAPIVAVYSAAKRGSRHGSPHGPVFAVRSAASEQYPARLDA